MENIASKANIEKTNDKRSEIKNPYARNGCISIEGLVILSPFTLDLCFQYSLNIMEDVMYCCLKRAFHVAL